MKRESFDYGEMAANAKREGDALWKLLVRRRETIPPKAADRAIWEKEEKMLVEMIFEQRALQHMMERRAKKRGEKA